jgi:hypothetical protein
MDEVKEEAALNWEAGEEEGKEKEKEGEMIVASEKVGESKSEVLTVQQTG